MPQAVLSSTSTSKRAEVAKGFFFGIAGALIGLLTLFFGLIYFQLGVPTRSTIWAYEINQKKLKKAASIQGPKLLLVGGSATLFGMQAELIEAKLDYPTVNLGTHAGLGIGYMLHLAKQAAKPGDTVLLAFEYNTFTFGLVRRDGVYVDYLFARDPEYFRDLPWPTKFQIAMSLTVARLRKGVRNRFHPEPAHVPPGIVYDPTKLNVYGDQLGNDAANRPPASQHRKILEASRVRVDTLSYRSLGSAPGFELVTDFLRWARMNDIRVLATYPNILEHPSYRSAIAKKTIQEIQDFYHRQGVPMIGSFEESMMPASMFFDTCYHMTREGAAIRTERLIPHLAAALNRERK
jgi:hypothetical protein